MYTLEIPRKDWADYLSLVSDVMDWTGASVWLEEADGRCRPLATKLPFGGINVDRARNRRAPIEIALQTKDGPGIAVTHRIETPERVWVGVDDYGMLNGLLVEDREERRTLLRFEGTPKEAPGKRHLAFLARFSRAPF